ncbi:MAG: TonB-dependent receptor [Phycisphaerae bacterium]
MSKKGVSSIQLIQKFVFLLMLALVFVPNARLLAQQQDTNKPEDVFEMPLEKLMEVEVVSTATLTETKQRLVPAAVTTITAEQVRSSGARSLYELLDIYVPNLQWSRQHWENDQLGLRGIISDRNDKFLLLVNGRNMNDRTHAGVVTELDQVMLGDIHHVDVIRGPGSAMYGPGAVSMVINIITYNSDTFQGTEVTTRLGAIEEFYTTELKHGLKFDSNDGGIFVYSGIGRYIGASKYDAPQIYPFDFPTTGTGTAPSGTVPGEGTKAGHAMTNTFVNRDGADALGTPPLKIYTEVKKDNWDIWGRLERGGKQFPWATESIAREPYGNGDSVWWNRWAYLPGNDHYRRPNFYTYWQATGYVGYKQEVADNLNIDYAFSYQSTSNVQERESRYGQNYREDNYYAKILVKWEPAENHKIAFGTEYLLNKLGRKPWEGLGYKVPKYGGSSGGAKTKFYNPELQRWGWNVQIPTWDTTMYSFLGEWQWKINDKWTSFIGGRIDHHTFTDRMFSPRLALIYTPNERDTFKGMWARSVRAAFEEDMKKHNDSVGGNTDPEKLDSLEFRYERQQSKNLDLAASVFVHYNLQALGWSEGAQEYAIAGTERTYGIELEASYHTDKTRFTISHGYTKLYSFYLDPTQRNSLPNSPNQSITAEPYGYGDDLTNWSNHNTKLVYQRKLDDKWTFDASMRIYWGFPGMKDMDKYYPYAGVGKAGPPATQATGNMRLIEDGWERAYRGSYFLDLGLQYKASKNLEIGITGYNLLGIFNKDLNKRNFVETKGIGDFRSAAPALGVTLTYKF